jgi:hypothetical protein
MNEYNWTRPQVAKGGCTSIRRQYFFFWESFAAYSAGDSTRDAPDFQSFVPQEEVNVAKEKVW